MDHLPTDEDRRARWYYSKPGIGPHYLSLRSPSRWQDLLQVPPDERPDPTKECVYDFVYCLPFDWLQRNTCSQKNNDESCNSENGSDESPPANHTMILDNYHQAPGDLLRQILDVHGFAVISGVLSTRECHEALELAWDWMEAASRAEAWVQQQQDGETTTQAIHRKLVNRNDPSSHSARDGSSYFPRSVEGGIMPFYGAGHSAFAWKIRSHPNVKRIFAELYNNNNQDLLLSSLDGVILWTEPSTDCGWFHIDQNPVQRPQASSVQGLVHLTAVTPETGGNVLVVQSHRDFDRGHFLGHCDSDTPLGRNNTDKSVVTFYRDRLCEIGDDDWLEIDPNDSVLLNPRRMVTVLLNAGDVLLWDSRVAHCSYPPASSSSSRTTTTTTSPSVASSSTNTTTTSRHGFLRAATLVTMVPCSSSSSSSSSVMSEQVRRERRQAVDDSRTLTHWVNKAAPLGEERPEHVALERACVEFMRDRQQRDDCSKKVLLSWDDLSDDQKSLVVGR